jgi:hypothetical protein
MVRGSRCVRRDGGQAAIVLVAVVAVLMVTMSVAAATMGRTTIDRTRAQTAADAAALAGLDGGVAASSQLAARHGATVVAWTEDGHEVTVKVRVGDTTATARATDAP